MVGLFEGTGVYVPLAAYLKEDLGTTRTTLTFDRRLTPAARSRLHRYAADCFGERAQVQDTCIPFWQETRLGLFPLGLILGPLCAGFTVWLWQKSRIRRSRLWYPVCTLFGGLGAVLLAGTLLWPLAFSHLAWGFLVPLAADTLFGVFLLRLAGR